MTGVLGEIDIIVCWYAYGASGLIAFCRIYEAVISKFVCQGLGRPERNVAKRLSEIK